MKHLIIILFLPIIILAQSKAKYEPEIGCYLGAFIVNDTVVKGNIDTFENLTNKEHSIYFSYAAYGQPFPKDWVNYYSSKGAAVQIAFEPNNGLAVVNDDEYIRNWAREARKSGAMIFLRWACEMNGSWVAWYGNPSLYIEKFRLIYNIFKEEAPNVALVWAPNDVPNDPQSPPNYVHAYYPGDNYVDWVGIDFYGVYYYEDGIPERVDPRNKLRVVYDTYSNRKPIMICEWAATHYTKRVIPNEDCTSYCIGQMNSLYNNVKIQFPKLKAICWFDMNSLTTNKCNFSLTENINVLNNYKLVIQDSFYLKNPIRNVPQVNILNISEDSVLRNSINVISQIKSDVILDSIICYLDNFRVGKVNTDSGIFNINTTNFPDGRYKLKIVVYSSSGFSNFESINVIIDNSNNYTNEIIDDQGDKFSTIGLWNVSTSQPDRYGPFYHFSYSGSGENKAIYTPTINQAGYYNIYSFWSEHSNRASNTPYIVFHQGTKDTVMINQRMNGGRWNLLGKYYFDLSSSYIEINNNANGIVIADAVRIEWFYPSKVLQDEINIPENFVLYQNYPNPFNPITTIEYDIPTSPSIPLLEGEGRRERFVTLIIYDILGRVVETLVHEQKVAGKYSVEWNASKYSSGVYYYQLNVGEFRSIKKMMLVK